MSELSMIGLHAKPAIVAGEEFPRALLAQSVLIQSGLALALVDRKHTVRFMTPAATSMFQLREGKPEVTVADLQRIMNDLSLMRDVENVLSGAEPVERAVHARDGRWYMRRLFPYRISDLAIDGVVVLFADESERERAMRELRTAKQRAEHANAASLRQLVAACHDLRQPMHTLGLIGGLLAQSIKEPLAQRLAAQMDSTLRAMSSLLCTLHYSCKVTAEPIRPELSTFKLGNVFEALQRDFRYLAESHGTQLRIVPCGLALRSDLALFEQILRSLLEHVMKTAKGRVLLGCRRQRDGVCIELWSQQVPAQPGLEASSIERVSTLPFGIDLAKRLASVLGFRLKAAQRAGGPAFALYIPLNPVAAPLLAEVPPQAARSLAGAHSSADSVQDDAMPTMKPAHEITIQVVDDDESARLAVQRMLQAHGYNVETHDSAEAYLAADQPSGDSCLLLDAHLTGMSGVDLLNRLSATDRCPPTIMVSGRGDIHTAVHAMKAGAIDFVEKPLRAERLLSTIERALSLLTERQKGREERQKISARLSRLTPRQKQVMDLMLDGKSSKAIAASLFMCQRTVESHRAKVMKNMGVRSLAELARQVSRVMSSAS
jgi:two-component system CheB/CheR fusion protein